MPYSFRRLLGLLGLYLISIKYPGATEIKNNLTIVDYLNREKFIVSVHTASFLPSEDRKCNA